MKDLFLSVKIQGPSDILITFKKFKKKHPDVTVDKEDFAFNVMMVPVDKAIDNEIGEYFE